MSVDNKPTDSTENIRVDIEEIRQLKARLTEINLLNFDKIDWYFGGKKVDVPAEIKEEWKYIGLNNADFPSYHS